MELSRPEVLQRHDHLSICPVWACPWAKNFSILAPMGSRLCWMHIPEFETAGQIYSIQSSMELSGPVVVQSHGHLLPICSRWSCPWAQKVVKSGTTGVPTLRNTYLWNHWMDLHCSMVFYKLVVVQYHGLMTFTLDFQGQIMKKPYQRNRKAGWHGTKGMWIDRKWDTLCGFEIWALPWPWPWFFKGKFKKSCISGMGGLINMKQQGCELK